MVVIHVKFQGGEDQFLYETTGDTSNDTLLRELVDINNTRVRIAYLCGAMSELAEHGPSKPHGEEGIDHIQQLNGGTFVEKADNYKEDPSGSRTGNGIGEQMTNVFNDVCRDAEAYISKDRALARKALTKEGMEEKLQTMKGAVTMAFPMGLPKHDPVYAALEGEEGLDGTQAQQGLLDLRPSCGAPARSSSERN